MPRRKLPYKEGDWFAVPLSEGGYALGVVARMNNRGGLLAYFFGPRYDSVPTIEEARGKAPEDAVAITMVGDLGLLYGTWKVIGRIEPWGRDRWPLPVFGRYDEVFGLAWRIHYAEDLLHELCEERTTVEDARSLPEDGLWGYAYAEIRLSRLLRDAPD